MKGSGRGVCGGERGIVAVLAEGKRRGSGRTAAGVLFSDKECGGSSKQIDRWRTGIRAVYSALRGA